MVCTIQQLCPGVQISLLAAPTIGLFASILGIVWPLLKPGDIKLYHQLAKEPQDHKTQTMRQ